MTETAIIYVARAIRRLSIWAFRLSEFPRTVATVLWTVAAVIAAMFFHNRNGDNK